MKLQKGGVPLQPKMRPANLCPQHDELLKYARGVLPATYAPTIRAHIDSCDRCAKTLVVLRNDMTAQFHPNHETPDHQSIDSDPNINKTPKQIHEEPVFAIPVSAPNTDEPLALLAPPHSPDELGWLGVYRVRRVVGKGGMGVVVEAEDTQLKRTVALKIMKPSLVTDNVARHRFVREAQATAGLQHDNIVTVFQANEHRGVPYLVMQMLRGHPLDQLLKNGRSLHAPQIVRIATDVARGLSAVHKHGLIHRDIKPSNLWLEREHGGRVKIVDFGVARAIDNTQPARAEIPLTQPGVIIGTPSYMAPEQARGEVIDPRADLFSLGCVLYHLCTGSPPFRGSDVMATLHALANHQPQPPEQCQFTHTACALRLDHETDQQTSCGPSPNGR